MGGGSGQSTSTQEWALIDTGMLTITNQRVIFDGGQQDRIVALDKIVSVVPKLRRDRAVVGCIELTAEGRQKSMMLDTEQFVHCSRDHSALPTSERPVEPC